jgi:hypothetical protein
LQEKTVAVLGVGAIGSHAAQQLTRAGIARLRLVDHDLLWPVNLTRHAAPPGTPAGTPKTTALREDLELYPWIDVEEPEPPSGGIVWTLDSIERVLKSADLTIDATGHGGLAELVGRVAHAMGRPYVSVALFQGGRVARVRRQANPDDVPLLRRPHLDRYPEIPPLPEEVEYVGTEVGCLARVHNAPPISVIHAAALAVGVAIDHLTGRNEEPDEVIEVIRPGEAPFDQIGRLRREDLPITVDMSETAQRALRDAAHHALPNETGGVLLGCVIDERPVIAEVIEITDPDATARCYTIPEGRVNDAVSEAQARDPRLGYLGEWHSHPSGAGPSPLDLATMLGAAQDSGTSDPILVLVHPRTSDSRTVTAYATTRAGLRTAEICVTGDLPATDLAAS